MVDPHVHLRDWEQSDKETIEHALSVASKIAVNRVFDMPNTKPTLTDRDTIIKRLDYASSSAKKYNVHYHVFAGLTNDDDQVRGMVKLYRELFPSVIGLKLFLSHSTGNMGITEFEDQKRIVRVLTEEGYDGVLAVHAEKEALNHAEKYDPFDFSTHSDARPPESEIEAVKDIIKIVKEVSFPGHLHICHISTEGAVNEVLKAKKEGLSISMGATCHHALLNRNDAKERGRYLKMNPPLREEKDRAFIFNALRQGLIDFVETDHAPHTLQDKEKGASGIPAFSGLLLLYESLRKEGLREAELSSLFGANALRIYGLESEKIKLPTFSRELFEEVSLSYPIHPF